MSEALTNSELLAQPLTLPSGVVLKNRLVKSAMSEALGSFNNRVTEQLVTLYERWARGGIGLCITGNVMIDRRALGEPGNVVLEDDRDLELLQRWARAGTEQGTHLWMQLNHPGKQVMRSLVRDPVAPSAIGFDPKLARYFATPRALSDAEIEDIIARFGRAAGLAKQAGFTGVQIHGAHGYLVSQFLSGHHNQRTDRWGGDAKNRRRFVLEVFTAIRAEVGASFPVGIKLNSADFQKGGFSEEESLELILALRDAGVDLVEISGGTYEAPAMTGHLARESTRKREAYFLEFAERARGAVRELPLVLTGGFRSSGGMAAALRDGAVDLIGLARSIAIEPDAPRRLLAGLEPQFEVKPISTGISMVDKMAMMEIMWYSRQLQRMARGRDPVPDESGLRALLGTLVKNGYGTLQTRLRA